LKNGKVDDMNKAKEALTQASHKLAEAIYKEASSKTKAGGANGGGTGSAEAGNAAGNATGTPGSGGPEAVDAEVVDEGKK
jgi:molecular chaperone DnaK